MTSHNNVPKIVLQADWRGTLGKPTQQLICGPCRGVAVLTVLILFHGKLNSQNSTELGSTTLPQCVEVVFNRFLKFSAIHNKHRAKKKNSISSETLGLVHCSSDLYHQACDCIEASSPCPPRQSILAFTKSICRYLSTK